MASNLTDIECPQCGRTAIEDYYYKIHEIYIACGHCGYTYSKTLKPNTGKNVEYEEEENAGHGVFVLVPKAGYGKRILFDSPLQLEEIQKYLEEYLAEDTDREKSFLVVYKDSTFIKIIGQPTEDFHLNFKEYKKKMKEMRESLK